MELMKSHFEPCTICNDVYTPLYTEVEPGLNIYICEDCIEAARYNFIWLCIHCGRAYLRPKKGMINAVTGEEQAHEENKVIQVIGMCHKCDPNGTERYMKLEIINMEC